MNRVLIALLMGSIFLSSCKKELGLFRSTDKKFSVNNAEFDYLSAKAKFKFNNGEQKISASANFRVQNDSVIWASISPALGVELARVKITREKIQAIDKLKRDYYEFTFEELSKQYGVQITYELVEAIAIGNSLFLPEKRKDVTEEEKYFKYEKLEGQYGINHFIGRESKKMEQLYAYDATTHNSVTVNYSEFQPVQGQIIPHTIKATVYFANQRRKGPVEVEIDYNRTELPTEPLNFPFSVSKKYKRK